MRIGSSVPAETIHKNSSKLIRRLYGSRVGAPGDSPEGKVLLTSGSLISVSCGLIAWAWVDYLQNFDSIAYLGGWVLLILWLTGSAISRPGFIVMICLLLDAVYPWSLSLQGQMSKNSILGFIIVSGITNSIIRAIIQIPCAAVDSVVYCYAIEMVKRRRIRSLELDELMHVEYLGDQAKLPPNTRLERVIVTCPAGRKPGHKITVEVESGQYEVIIPAAAKPGREFEVAIPIPFNRTDVDDEPDEGNDGYEETAVDGSDTGTVVIHDEDDDRKMQVLSSEGPPRR
jgi:hypothetical protein